MPSADTYQLIATYDDGPSEDTPELAEFHKKHNIPALFFVRGDQLSKHFNMMVDLLGSYEGIELGNHTMTHIRASRCRLKKILSEIDNTQRWIDFAYECARGKKQEFRTFRHPHLDCGMGGEGIIDTSRLTTEEIAMYERALKNDLYHPETRTDKWRNWIVGQWKHNRIQKHLRMNGYCMPFTDVTTPWLKNSGALERLDCPVSWSSGDWQLTERHQRGNYGHVTIDTLKENFDADPSLTSKGSVSVILLHDQAERNVHPNGTTTFKPRVLIKNTKALIEHMLLRGAEFVDPFRTLKK